MTNPEPGWYQQPPGSGVMRYWDGRQWTQHTPLPAPNSPNAYYARQSVTYQKKRTSHGIHLFLTIVTFGLWGLFVWIPITLWHNLGPDEEVVTRYS